MTQLIIAGAALLIAAAVLIVLGGSWAAGSNTAPAADIDAHVADRYGDGDTAQIARAWIGGRVERRARHRAEAGWGAP